jgi:hypothetical protein
MNNTRQGPGLKMGVGGLLILALYSLFHFNPFSGNSISSESNEHTEKSDPRTQERTEYVFKIKNKVILVNEVEKHLEELGTVFIEIKQKNGFIKLLKHGEESVQFINQVREALRNSAIDYTEAWEAGKEPKLQLEEKKD